MGLQGLNGILQGMRRSRAGFGKQILGIADEIANATKRVRSPRMEFNSTNLTELPKPFRELTKGLKHPRVKIGYNGGNGQATMGVSIMEGNRPVGQFALNYDKTVGTLPMSKAKFQFKMPNEAADNVMSMSVTLNPGATVTDDFARGFSNKKGVYRIEHADGGKVQFNTVINSNHTAEFRTRTGFEMPETHEITQMSDTIAEQSSKILDEYAGMIKPKKAKALKKPAAKKAPKQTEPPKATTTPATKTKIDYLKNAKSYTEEAKTIMQFEGPVTLDSANRAKDILMRKMGYDPKLVTIIGEPGLSGTGCFNAATGQISVDTKMAKFATHFDEADLLAHELTHMDEAVKTAKAIGIDEYEKLIMSVPSKGNEVFNRTFFEKAIRYAKIEGFDPKPFVEEHKRLAQLAKHTNGKYQHFMSNFRYAKSNQENICRAVEKKLIAELQSAGVEIKSCRPLEKFGAEPYTSWSPTFEKIEEKLAKYSLVERNKIFNDTYEQMMKAKSEEFYNLTIKFQTSGVGLNDAELTRFKELEKQLNLDDNGILNEILKRL